MSLLKRNRVDAALLRHPVHFLSLGFGSGLSPYAPGTAGTLVAIPLFWLMAPLPLLVYLGVIAVLFVFACLMSGNPGRFVCWIAV
jgi:phosphatidylglycerophosphatase A